jgi:acetyl esterase/lipase
MANKGRSIGAWLYSGAWTTTLAAAVGAWAVVHSQASAAAPKTEAAPKKLPVKAVKDIAYYTGAGQHPIKHKLDLFLPDGRKDFPVVLFVHGGAWLHGDKSFLGFYSSIGRALAARGIGVAVTNYRLSPAVKHPEHVKDVARAFAWVHKNIGKYGGRADRLFVCGHSAGGHLVALLATDERYLRAEGLSSKNVRGVIPISGVYDIPDGLLPRVFGNGPNAGKNASPIRYARAALPPFLVLWADKDLDWCGKEASEEFVKALKDKGNKVVNAVEIKESNHYSIIMQAALPNSVVSRAIVNFILAHG